LINSLIKRRRQSGIRNASRKKPRKLAKEAVVKEAAAKEDTTNQGDDAMQNAHTLCNSMLKVLDLSATQIAESKESQADLAKSIAALGKSIAALSNSQARSADLVEQITGIYNNRITTVEIKQVSLVRRQNLIKEQK